jgi:hypothetical protein
MFDKSSTLHDGGCHAQNEFKDDGLEKTGPGHNSTRQLHHADLAGLPHDIQDVRANNSVYAPSCLQHAKQKRITVASNLADKAAEAGQCEVVQACDGTFQIDDGLENKGQARTTLANAPDRSPGRARAATAGLGAGLVKHVKPRHASTKRKGKGWHTRKAQVCLSPFCVVRMRSCRHYMVQPGTNSSIMTTLSSALCCIFLLFWSKATALR